MKGSNLSEVLGRVLMPEKHITVTVYTVGGTDDDGNDVEEPIVFSGTISEAREWCDDYDTREEVDDMVRAMPDGYLMVESERFFYDVYSMDDVAELLEDERTLW